MRYAKAFWFLGVCSVWIWIVVPAVPSHGDERGVFFGYVMMLLTFPFGAALYTLAAGILRALALPEPAGWSRSSLAALCLAALGPEGAEHVGLQSASRAAVVAVVAAMGAIAHGHGTHRDDRPQMDARRPTITVKASPRLGYVPANISVSAELKGGASDYEPFYCATIVWEWGDGTTSESTPDCEPYEPGTSRVRRFYSAVHRYAIAGRFEVRVQLKKRDGIVGSGSQPVIVLPPPREPSGVPD